MSQPTAHQQLAIEARGNVLVEAGAGAGKTRTLVQRCLARVLDPNNPVSLDEILMVTFTEAAAAEMRRRIGEELEKAVAGERTLQGGGKRDGPGDEARLQRLEEQLALLDTARISTLHSFCLQLVREHFHELGLDPQLTVLDEAEAAVLAQTTLDRVLQAHYAGRHAHSVAVQNLILAHGNGRDDSIRRLVRRIHSYARSLDDPAGWLRRQLAMFAETEPVHWRAWRNEGVDGWKREWIESLQAQPADNANAHRCRAALETLPHPPTDEALAPALDTVLAQNGGWPRGRTEEFRKPLKKLFDEAKFLRSLVAASNAEKEQGARRDACPAQPLDEDWTWVRGHMTTLLELVREFGEAFAAAKREQGALDFADLEQFALRLLWDADECRPTRIAEDWRAKLKLVFVDECQDINAAQDRIITCLSREGAEANRFLVGDVKQSIYRFRLANPRIFQDYSRRWRGGEANAQVIPLSENFRSHEAILDFVNEVFAAVMRPEIGGVAYDEEAKLRFGNREGRTAMTREEEDSRHANTLPLARPSATLSPDGGRERSEGAARVELHLRLTSGRNDTGGDSEDASADLTATELEARFVARRLRELKEEAFPVWDDKVKDFRAVEWADMAVLLRSPRSRAETYAKEFTRLGVPLEAERGGFYDTTEVSDLLSLLTILDNPLQDIPLLAVLRSPIVGLRADELATIRLVQKGRFWAALRRFQSEISNFKSELSGTPAALAAAESAWPKVDRFLRAYACWRALARQGSPAACLESVLDATHYEDWLHAQARGAQRLANVRRLLGMARSFDQFQRQGLFRFLRFVELQRQVEAPDRMTAIEGIDAVRLMSIHQSKGLEFPVVALAGLGTKFNLGDLRDEIILDEEFGLCPVVRPPRGGAGYPSLAHWLAARRQCRETLGEEIRLLYVAMTRARDKLILAGMATLKEAETRWAAQPPLQLAPSQLLGASRPLDWLGPLLPRLCGTTDWAAQRRGQSRLCSWRVAAGEESAVDLARREPAAPSEHVNDDEVDALIARLNWRYPHESATKLAAKTSVTEVRRRMTEEAEGEAKPLFQGEKAWNKHAPCVREPAGRSAGRVPGVPVHGERRLREPIFAEIGIAHHLFLQHMDLGRTQTPDTLRAEAERLTKAGVLSGEQAAALDFEALAAFWNSDVGRRIGGHAGAVKRELPFTARFAAGELSPPDAATPADDSDFVVVQGVVDLAVLLPGEIWLADFKTDDVNAADLADRTRQYEPQLRFYARALARIYRRPVTRRWLHFLALRRTVEV